MTTVIFILGAASVVAGVSMWSVPAAFVVAGLILAAAAILLERAAPPVGGGDVQ